MTQRDDVEINNSKGSFPLASPADTSPSSFDQSNTHSKGSCGIKTYSQWTCGSFQDPVTITVKDLFYTVSDKEIFPGCRMTCGKPTTSLAQKKVLLEKVSMIARPGELLAIIGPSGSGKTTLLNVLAMRSPSWRIPLGTVKFNGRSETKNSVKSTINYVMAHDKMLPYLTVYETLESAAALKLPHLTKQERLIRVEAVIDDMSLENCRDIYIGGEWRIGISAGEMKRVAIGMELLDEPSVLILDEPTSGLDGSLSVKIVELLLKEARKGRTIITTVHQPSSQIFEMFDRFLLMRHGQVVFHGSDDRALPYFANLGFSIPKNWNPSDFLLDLVSDRTSSTTENHSSSLDDDDSKSLDDGVTSERRQQQLVDDFRHSLESDELIKEIDAFEATLHNTSTTKKANLISSKRRWTNEVNTLWKRTTRNAIRNPLTTIVTLLVQAMQGLILGGILFHLSKVGPGSKPESLLARYFWESPWIQAISHGVDGHGNHPFVSVIERGVDGKGSFVLLNETSSDWQNSTLWMLDHTMACLNERLHLKDLGYPQLPLSSSPAVPNWDEWTPERIYTDLIIAYQIFDRVYPTGHHEPLDLSFFKECKELHANVNLFFFCVMQKGKPILDDFVLCAGFRPLPSARRHLDEKRKEQQRVDLKRGPRRRPLVVPKRQLVSISDTIGMDTAIKDIIGSDLMEIVNAASLWITRVTSCQEPLCHQFDSIKTFFVNWGTVTLDTTGSVLNLAGCLFFVSSVLGFASYDALLTFPQERPLFNRETANGLYSPSSYYTAKNFADLPFQIIPSILMATIFYFMVGFDVTFHQYFAYFTICSLTCFCAYGFGYMISAMAPRMEVAILIAPLTLVVWLVLAGFFLRDGDVPYWINWFKYFSFYRWSFFGLVINQFPSMSYFGTLPNSVHLALVGVTETSLSVCIGALLCLGFSYRLLGYVFLAFTNRRVGLEA